MPLQSYLSLDSIFWFHQEQVLIRIGHILYSSYLGPFFSTFTVFLPFMKRSETKMSYHLVKLVTLDFSQVIQSSTPLQAWSIGLGMVWKRGDDTSTHILSHPIPTTVCLWKFPWSLEYSSGGKAAAAAQVQVNKQLNARAPARARDLSATSSVAAICLFILIIILLEGKVAFIIVVLEIFTFVSYNRHPLHLPTF